MKIGIEVKDRAEGDALKAGLADPVTRAIVVTMDGSAVGAAEQARTAARAGLCRRSNRGRKKQRRGGDDAGQRLR
jgi:hypothetical protein